MPDHALPTGTLQWRYGLTILPRDEVRWEIRREGATLGTVQRGDEGFGWSVDRGPDGPLLSGIRPLFGQAVAAAIDAILAPTARQASGLPIASVEPLNAAERDALHELRRRHQLAAETVADILDCGRVDRALDGLQHVAAETDGLALATAAKLGGNR